MTMQAGFWSVLCCAIAAALFLCAGNPAARADSPHPDVDCTQQLETIRADIGRVERQIKDLNASLAEGSLTAAEARQDRRLLVIKQVLLSHLQDRELIVRAHFRATGGHDSWDPNDKRIYQPYTTTAVEDSKIDDAPGNKRIIQPRERDTHPSPGNPQANTKEVD